MKLAKDITFKKGMKIKLHITSPYGKEFDEVKECEVIKITKYKRGNKLNLVQHYEKQNSTGFGIWQNEYPHLIEIV